VLGCATAQRNVQLELLNETQPVELKLQPLKDRKETTQYFSKINTEIYELDQKVREKEESVNFKTEAYYLEDDKKSGHVRVVLKTIQKDGPIDLNDLAFPELDERIEFVYSPRAEVLYAGAYPESSVFFVPSISLPNQPVKVGETWELQKSWINSKTSIPLRLQLVSILKNVYKCGNYKCADIEVSGEVDIMAPISDNQKFQSQISGRLLFLIDKGSLVWSEIKSEEIFWLQESRMKAHSCLVSVLKTPKEESVLQLSNSLNCDPNSTLKVPFEDE
jgi:hypothetical protein